MSEIILFDSSNGLLTGEQIGILKQSGVIPSDAPAEQVLLFAAICKERGLSAFSKEIYLVGYNDRQSGGKKFNPIVGIGGFRKLAGSTGQFAGVDDAKFDLQPDGTYKTAAQFKGGDKPDTCTITVYRVVCGIRCAFTATVKFSEFSTGMQKWVTMPFQMIMKVAEAHAIRKGFAEATNGVFVEEEIGNMQGETVQTIKVLPVMDKSHPRYNFCIESLKKGTISVDTLKHHYNLSQVEDEFLEIENNYLSTLKIK